MARPAGRRGRLPALAPPSFPALTPCPALCPLLLTRCSGYSKAPEILHGKGGRLRRRRCCRCPPLALPAPLPAPLRRLAGPACCLFRGARLCPTHGLLPH